MKKNILIFGICSFLFACQHEEFLVENNSEESSSSLTVEDSTFVDVSLAKRVATTSKRHGSRSASSNVEEVITLSDTENKPWCYVVNHGNNNGYAMISATKNYHPVLMWSDKGNFDVNDIPEAAQFYIDGYRANIETLKNAPFDSIYRYRQEWMEYEEKPELKRVESRSLPTDVLYCMQQHEALWWSEGYQYSPIATNGLNLPTSVYENAVFMAELSMREDYMETSYIVRMEEVETINVPQMLTTQWHQYEPYNNYVVLEHPDCPTGCTATAIGQIMKYHQKPSNWNWSQMLDYTYDFLSYNEVGRLMVNIGNGVNMQYTPDGSWPYNGNNGVKNYFIREGYENAQLVEHNEFTVRAQLLRKLPVYMSGKPTNGDAHAWVCDGMNEDNFRTVYYLMTILETNPLSYLAHEIKVEDERAGRTFHLNWGAGGSFDGWFRDNNMSVQIEGVEYLYNTYRQDIINIY